MKAILITGKTVTQAVILTVKKRGPMLVFSSHKHREIGRQRGGGVTISDISFLIVLLTSTQNNIFGLRLQIKGPVNDADEPFN